MALVLTKVSSRWFMEETVGFRTFEELLSRLPEDQLEKLPLGLV
jgi:hypothetical protein